MSGARLQKRRWLPPWTGQPASGIDGRSEQNRDGGETMRRIARTGAAWASILLLAACTSAPEPIDLPGERAFSESITIAPDGTAYVGSLSGGVWRVALDSGRVEPWI